MKAYLTALGFILATSNVIANEAPATDTIISANNVNQFSHVLDEPIQALIKQGALSVTVGPQFDIPQNSVFALSLIHI